ncbi:hypothetical protein PENSUB_1560 [Penicillium subrubescens]|uniref:Uncharacterized protein n=1 Tax=Penicillium subrubescens TaxID=1316194 RepID=A0A1Q5UK17_9EURO|nr:hypothetical protein PENSUB_1560 [Penicillium subrubescens]
MANELVYRQQPSAEKRMSFYPGCRSLHGESTILIEEDAAARGEGMERDRGASTPPWRYNSSFVPLSSWLCMA